MDTLVPIFVCVVLPVSIVSIIYATAINRDNKRARVLIKAIEANNGIDADKLAKALEKPNKTAREILNQRLLRGCTFSFLGLALYLFSVIVNHMFANVSDGVFVVSLFLALTSVAVGLSYLIVYFVTRKQVKD